MVENPSGDCPSVTTYIGKELFSELQHLARYFPPNMLWSMTLAPKNEAISREIMRKKTYFRKKKLMILGGHIEDVRIVLLSKNPKIV
jgi:hypothetical protein